VADRSVIVALGANVSGFTAGMRTAQRSAQDFARNGLDEIARREQSLNQLSRNAGVLGLALTGMAGVAVKKFADFDHAMSAVEATGDDAKKSIDALREAALAASEQGFTPKDAAQGIENLAKAGVSASDILSGALTGSLDLAAAGSLGVAEAAETTSVALTQFNLGGEKATHVADLLAAGAGKAMGDVHDLAYALRMGGLVAAQTGLSIEETTAALASFASAGLLGSDAGTSLKTMLQRLTPRSKEAQAQFDQLGISAYDAQGNFIGLENFAGMLQAKMKDLTPEARNAAMSIMFGSDAVRAATVLYDQGASGMRNWIQAVDDQGYAAETAATKLDNLKGDVQLLGATFDRTMIEMGSSADGPLRSLVQGTTGVVEKLGELPASAQTALLGIVGGGGLVLLGIAGMGKLTVAISETRTAMAALGISARAATVSMGAIGIALGAGAILLGNWAKDAADAAAMTDDFLATLDEFGNTTDKTVSKIADSLANTNFGRSLGEKIMGDDSVNVIDWARDAGIAIDDLTGYILGQEDAVKRVQAAQDDYLSQSFSHSESDVNKMEDLTGILDKQADSLSEAEKVAVRKALADKELGLAAEGATPAADALGEAAAGASIGIDQVGDAAIEAQKALEDWRVKTRQTSDAFVNPAGAYQAAIDASTAWAEAQADATEDAEDSWESFYDGQSVSMGELLDQQRKQLEDQVNYNANMISLAGQVSSEYLNYLLGLGTEAAPLIAELANALPEELAASDAMYQQGVDNGTEFVDGIQSITDGREVTATLNADGSIAYEVAEETVSGMDALAVQPWMLGVDPTPAIDTAAKSTIPLLSGMTVDAWDLSARPENAMSTGRQTQTSIGGMTPSAWSISAKGDPALEEANRTKNSIDAKNATIKVGAVEAPGLWGAVNGFVASISSRTAVIGVSASMARPLPGITSANGNLIDYYAGGGMRESHVAQIAPAGAWRVWAEPETGGEAYIPFALSKRARSLSIWEETGKRLGVQGFADGSQVAPAAYQPMQRLYAAPAQSAPVIQVAAPPTDATKVEVTLAMDSAGVMHVVDQRIAAASATRSASMRAGRPR